MKSLLLVIALLALSCCAPPPETDLQRAFYHWKSTIDSAGIQGPLERLDVKKVYLRAFDIDWDHSYEGPVPVGPLTNPEAAPTGVMLIPTIFITNRTFRNLSEAALPELVDKVQQKLAFLFSHHYPIQEVQFDCDWTRTTRERYFQFLRLFKKATSWDVSVTIRLHQVRYFEQTGIPPADRGMLMFYNMGALEDWEESNSILNNEKARPYLKEAGGYKLPLDLALPIFSWGVIFRNGKMIKLIHGLPKAALQDSSRFILLEKNRYRVKRSTYLEGLYLYRDDNIRLEKIEAKKLEEAVKLNLPLFEGRSFTLSFYHLDTTFINALSYGSHLSIVPLRYGSVLFV